MHGASVAYHLARRGITDVVLIERAAARNRSTGRNAGGVRPVFPRGQHPLSIESIALLERFEDEVGSPIDFHQDGYLFLLSTPSSVETFQRNVALQRSLGIDVAWLASDDAVRLAPGLAVEGVLGATFCQRDGIADPNGVTMGFAKAAQSRGVTIERDTEVTGITIDEGRIAGVETTRGEIATPIVVNAAGPAARAVGRMAGVDVPVDPYRRHIFIAQPPAGALVPASKIMVIDFETTFYFHREGAGILFGMGDPGEPSTFDTTVRWDFSRRRPTSWSRGCRRWPTRRSRTPGQGWTEMTPDANPIIGPVRERPGCS